MNKLLGIIALVVSVGALGITYFAPTQTQVKETIKEIAKDKPVGAIPGNEVFTEDFAVNGRRTYNYRVAMTQGTTTVCSIRWPNTGASTTLVYASGRFDHVATSGTIHAQFYRGEGPTSTTTPLFGLAVSATGTVVYATGTPPGGANAVGGGGDSDYLILDYKNATIYPIAINGNFGYCSATFEGN